jgi:PAS domain S-box-containing protein
MKNFNKLYFSAVYFALISSIFTIFFTTLIDAKYKELFGVIFIVIILALLFIYLYKVMNSILQNKIALEQTNESLQSSLTNYQNLLDATMEVIIISDENHMILEINRAALEIFGVKNKNDFIGINLLDLLPITEKLKVESALLVKSKKAYEIKVQTFDSKILTMLATGKNIIRDNKIIRISTLIDITELKLKNKQLLIQSKQAQMGEMISMIAHQWRQPLNAISATGINLSLLSNMKMLDEKKVQESSEFIQNQCQKMSHTIDTFMNFIKPSQEKSSFKISHTIDTVLSIMSVQLTNHDITIDVATQSEEITMYGNEDLLEQVIINLLSNARDAFDENRNKNKSITITIYQVDSLPVIDVKDNAGGIPEDIQEKIFNPYFTTKEQGKGTGIGLYMSLDIMKKSFDGDLIYHATEDGSKFEIVFGRKSK